MDHAAQCTQASHLRTTLVPTGMLEQVAYTSGSLQDAHRDRGMMREKVKLLELAGLFVWSP